MELQQLWTQNAQIEPETRRRIARGWKLAGMEGTPPYCLIKALVHLGQHDLSKQEPIDLSRPVTEHDMPTGMRLPPEFAIVRKDSKTLELHTEYENLDYKLLAGLMAIAASQNSRGEIALLAESVYVSRGDNSGLADETLLRWLDIRWDTVNRTLHGFLRELPGDLNMDDDFTIEITKGPVVIADAFVPEELDIKLVDILSDRYGIAGLESARFKGPALPELVMNLRLGMNTILVGPTGTGKSECVLESFRFADQTRDVQVIEGHESLREIDLLGGYVPTASEKGSKFVWADGILVRAMRNGSFLFVDEANRMPTRTLNVLLGVLSRRAVVLTEHSSETVECSEGFTVVMAMNQGQGYSVNSLDRALVDRFPAVIEFHYLTPTEEAQLVVERTGISEEIARIMAKLANDVRELARVGEFESGLSPRGLFAWATKYRAFVGEEEDKLSREVLVKAARQTWMRGVAGVGTDGYMEQEIVNKLDAMIYDAR